MLGRMLSWIGYQNEAPVKASVAKRKFAAQRRRAHHGVKPAGFKPVATTVHEEKDEPVVSTKNNSTSTATSLKSFLVTILPSVVSGISCSQEPHSRMDFKVGDEAYAFTGTILKGPIWAPRYQPEIFHDDCYKLMDIALTNNCNVTAIFSTLLPLNDTIKQMCSSIHYVLYDYRYQLTSLGEASANVTSELQCFLDKLNQNFETSLCPKPRGKGDIVFACVMLGFAATTVLAVGGTFVYAICKNYRNNRLDSTYNNDDREENALRQQHDIDMDSRRGGAAESESKTPVAEIERPYMKMV